MSLGIVEVIALLMGASGFSVGTNPTAPTPQAALEYALPDADIIAYADIGAIVPGNYKVFTNLANQPQIKASPELARAVKKMVAEVEGPRGLVKTMVGIDLASDISDVTASFKYVPKSDPSFVVAVHGKFTAATLEKVGQMTGKPAVKVGTGAWIDAGDGNAIGVTKTGVMLAGSLPLVRDRMADTYKAPALTTGTNLGHAAAVMAGKPVFALVVNLSATARRDLLKEAGKDTNFLTDLVKRHKLWTFSVHKDGLGWTWIDTTRAGADAMAMLSEGVVELIRASHIAPRGFAKILLASVDSYRGKDKQVDELIRRKADVLKIIESYTGDGQFKAQIDRDARANKISVRLTGKSLSEVAPLGGLLPVGGFAWLFLSKGTVKQAVDPATGGSWPTSPPPPPPAKKQGNAPKRP